MVASISDLGKLGIKKIAFLQAAGLAIYFSLIGTVMWNGEKLLPIKSALGPILFLTLFSVSILICGFLSLGYPFYLFWEKKQTLEALKLVAYTTKWLVGFLLIILLLITLF